MPVKGRVVWWVSGGGERGTGQLQTGEGRQLRNLQGEVGGGRAGIVGAAVALDGKERVRSGSVRCKGPPFRQESDINGNQEACDERGSLQAGEGGQLRNLRGCGRGQGRAGWGRVRGQVSGCR